MFTNKDIQHRKVFIVNGFEKRKLKVVNFQLALYDTEKEVYITKIPFHKILCLMVIGDMTLTSPFIERCNKNNVPIVVTKINLRLVFFYGNTAEGNFLLRKKQHTFLKGDTQIAKALVRNKVANQKELLKRTRIKNEVYQNAINICDEVLEAIPMQTTLQEILALEGRIAKLFFGAYYKDHNWKGRMQRTKIDMTNTIMDIGYTLLFNYIECMLRMFGFDLYVGVYHQLWFQRKSLVCDIVEPFRCLIDLEIRKNMNYKKFTLDDFEIKQDRYYLKRSESKKYYKIFMKALADNKNEIFSYIRDYYRCFMGKKSVKEYPMFKLK